jgi:hypothetical protein
MATKTELIDKIKRFRELLKQNARPVYESYKDKKTKKTK